MWAVTRTRTTMNSILLLLLIVVLDPVTTAFVSLSTTRTTTTATTTTTRHPTTMLVSSLLAAPSSSSSSSSTSTSSSKSTSSNDTPIGGIAVLKVQQEEQESYTTNDNNNNNNNNNKTNHNNDKMIETTDSHSLNHKNYNNNNNKMDDGTVVPMTTTTTGTRTRTTRTTRTVPWYQEFDVLRGGSLNRSQLETFFRHRRSRRHGGHVGNENLIVQRLFKIVTTLSSIVRHHDWTRTTTSATTTTTNSSSNTIQQQKQQQQQQQKQEQLCSAIASLGPLAVKIGQTLSQRDDLIGDEMANTLKILQTQNVPFDNDDAYAVIHESLQYYNGPLAMNLRNHSFYYDRCQNNSHFFQQIPVNGPTLFEYMSPDPVAAASLGQVYKAQPWKNDNNSIGQQQQQRPPLSSSSSSEAATVLLSSLSSSSSSGPVAVKVQRPDAQAILALDAHCFRLVWQWKERFDTGKERIQGLWQTILRQGRRNNNSRPRNSRSHHYHQPPWRRMMFGNNHKNSNNNNNDMTTTNMTDMPFWGDDDNDDNNNNNGGGGDDGQTEQQVRMELGQGNEATMTVSGVLDRVACDIQQELDYRIEAKNGQLFHQSLEFLGFVTTPNVVYATDRVLITEWISGRHLSDLKTRSQGVSLTQMAIQACTASMVLTGLVHADPHEGNMMLHDNERQVVFLDFGLMSRVQPEYMEAFARGIQALVAENWTALTEAFVDVGFVTQPLRHRTSTKDLWRQDPNYQLPQLTKDIENAMKHIPGGQSRFGALAQILQQEISPYWLVFIPPYILLLVRTFVTLEGMAASVDPNFNIYDMALPWAVKRTLSPSTPKGIQVFRSTLLTKENKVQWERLVELVRQGNQEQQQQQHEQQQHEQQPVSARGEKRNNSFLETSTQTVVKVDKDKEEEEEGVMEATVLEMAMPIPSTNTAMVSSSSSSQPRYDTANQQAQQQQQQQQEAKTAAMNNAIGSLLGSSEGRALRRVLKDIDSIDLMERLASRENRDLLQRALPLLVFQRRWQRQQQQQQQRQQRQFRFLRLCNPISLWNRRRHLSNGEGQCEPTTTTTTITTNRGAASGPILFQDIYNISTTNNGIHHHHHHHHHHSSNNNNNKHKSCNSISITRIYSLTK